MQGGDIVRGDGMGGESIYGGFFDDEGFFRDHDEAGLLSMANAGKNTNSSQFFVTLCPAPHLNKRNVVFGRVVDGMEVVRRMQRTPTDDKDRPTRKVAIADCGQLQNGHRPPRNCRGMFSALGGGDDSSSDDG